MNTDSQTAIQIKIQRLLAGERVVCSTADLDAIEPDYEVRSIPNPNQVGTLDCWLCWL